MEKLVLTDKQRMAIDKIINTDRKVQYLILLKSDSGLEFSGHVCPEVAEYLLKEATEVLEKEFIIKSKVSKNFIH